MIAWLSKDMQHGLQARIAAWREDDPDLVANRLEDIRITMLDMLGDEGERQYPQVRRRIRYSGDAQGLWYARADLMAALSGLHGERTARQRMVSLSAMFEGLLPKGLMSRPTTLMRN